MTQTSVATAVSPSELSFAQERMWFLEQLHLGAALNHCSTTLEMKGLLDLPHLQQCVNEIARRHEALRTRFAFLDGHPVQIVEPATRVMARLVDVTYLPEQDELLTKLVLDDSGRAFTLDKSPLMRLTLFRRSRTHHILQLTTHHIVWDAWSVNIFLRELLELYQCFHNGKPSTLPIPTAQYRDFARAEREWINTSKGQCDLAFWKERLADLPAISIPTDYSRPAVPTFHGAAHMFQFSEELTETIEAFCAERSVSLFMFAMAALQLYLSFLSGEKRVSVGVAVANRTDQKWEQVIGSFINVLVFPAELSAGESFTALLERVRNDALSIYEHGRYPFSHLIQELNPDRNLDLSPLFQVMLVYLSSPPPELELPGLQGTYWNVESVTAKQDLTLIMSVREGRCIAAWEYNSALFRQETIERFSRQFMLLVEALVNGRAISPSVLISDEEKALTYGWNSTAHPEWLRGTLAELLSLEHPADRIAVVCGEQHLSFGSLQRQVSWWTFQLKERVVGPESKVGILMRRSPDLLIALLSVLGTGGSYVPIDDHWPVARIQNVVTAAGIKLLIVDAETREFASSLAVEALELRSDILDKSGSRCVPLTVEAHNCAYTIFTSGSTGKPKGIEVSREAVWNLLKSLESELHFTEEEVFLAVTTVSFDIAVLEWAIPLMTGGKIILIPYERVRDAEELSCELERHLPTCMQATPSLWRMLVGSGWKGDPNLKVLSGGEALSADLASQLKGNSQEVWNLYGPTETTIWSTLGVIDTAVPDLGKPIANTAIHLLTGQFEQVPPGIHGEIFIAGLGVARGYLNQPRLTSEKFVPDPFSASPGARMFRTGDVGKWDGDGRLRFITRIDHQLKIHGVRVEAEEIEGCLRLHPAIRDAVVSLVSSDNDKRLIAYLTLRTFTPEVQLESLFRDIDEFVSERLSKVMVPSQFVILEKFQLMTSGKIDRTRLPIPARKPGSLPDISERPFLSSIEQQVLEAWKTSLGRYHIHTFDTFFNLGGNSLLAAQVCTILSKVLGVHIPVRLLFEFPRFEHFSQRVRELQSSGTTEQWPVVSFDAERRFEPFPLTDIQEAYLLGRSGLFELSNVSTHSYFEVDTSQIDVDRFELVWRKLIQRHDMLRAVFMDNTQRVLQTVPDYVIRRTDTTALSEEDRERLLFVVREEMSHAVHPADRWPLFEIRATRLSKDLVRLHFSIDALIGDAFSSALLFNDWRTLYLDIEAVLPEPKIQFRDYVLATRTLEDSDMFRRSRKYWIDRLDDTFRGPELPVVESVSNNAGRFNRRSLLLSPEAWQTIRTRALNCGLSPTTIIITAFSEVLAYWSRTQKFALNLTQFNRLPLHPDVNRLVGDFTSIMLLQVDATSPQTFAEFASKIQQRLWDDLDHRMFSGTRVLRELRARLGTGQEILAPVVFTSTLGMTLDQRSAENWGHEVYSISQTPQVWLDHKVFEDKGSLGVDWDFAEALFPEGVIDSMFGAYQRLLTSLAEDELTWDLPRHTLHEHLLLTPTPADQAVLFGGADTLHGVFLEKAKQNPGAVAVIAQDRTLTYGELDAWSSAFAARLMEQISAEEIVAVVLSKGWEQAVAVLAITRAGGAYMPIDPGEPEDRRFRMMQKGNVRFALTTERLAESLSWPDVCRPIVVTAKPQSEVFQEASVSGTQLAYVIYTSGSTGQPKGVMIEHHSAVNTLRDLVKRLDLGSTDRTLALSALSFDLSVFDCFGIWAAGGAIVYPDPAKYKDPLHWLALLESEKITVWNTVPALMEMLVETAGNQKLRFRWILLSGDWIPLSLPSRVAQRWPEARQISLGGATEASIWSILFPIERVHADWSRIPYGRAMCNQSMSVRHPSLEETPTWVIGEICIGGTGLARGYLGSQELTKERFITHPASGERLYRTGDLGRYLPTGDIEILGRADQQVKVNGYRIELAEVEAVLTAQPGIHQAIVNVETDAAGRKELVAYLFEKSKVVGPETRKNRTGASVSLKLAQRAIRSFPKDAITVSLEELLAPEYHERIVRRQSYRFFTDTPPSLTSVNEWFSAVEQRLSSLRRGHVKAHRSLEWISTLACRLQQTSVEGNVFPKYGYPSAGHLYPVQSYFSFADGYIPGLAGNYYYHPQEHKLVRVGDCVAATGSPPKLILVGELDAIESEYREASQRFCALEAGYMRALFLDTSLKLVWDANGLPLTDSQQVVAVYELDVDIASDTPQMPSLLLCVRQGGLHGAEPGFYRRNPGEKLSRLSVQAAAESKWFGNNNELFERCHFAIVASSMHESRDSFMDAGTVGQIMMEESVKFNLGLCPIGEISNSFLETAGLPGTIIHGWIAGQIDPVQTHSWMAMPPPPDREVLRQRCKERASRQLPPYMHPVRYFFVDQVPLTANNKVDRAMLKKVVQREEVIESSEGSASASEVEKTIAEMLESILKHPISDLKQSFFEMGASSLIIIQLHTMVNARYPDRISFQDFFDHSSIRGIAQLIEGEPAEQTENEVEVIDI